MTKKHLELVAAALHDVKPVNGSLDAKAQWWDTVDNFVRKCGTANPKFKSERFIVELTITIDVEADDVASAREWKEDWNPPE